MHYPCLRKAFLTTKVSRTQIRYDSDRLFDCWAHRGVV
jgi:hypothetical protein